MLRLIGFTVFLGLLSLGAGCSQETQEKAGSAAKATGDAIESAAKDAAANTKEAADKVERSLERNDDDQTQPELPAPPADANE